MASSAPYRNGGSGGKSRGGQGDHKPTSNIIRPKSLAPSPVSKPPPDVSAVLQDLYKFMDSQAASTRQVFREMSGWDTATLSAKLCEFESQAFRLNHEEEEEVALVKILNMYADIQQSPQQQQQHQQIQQQLQQHLQPPPPLRRPVAVAARPAAPPTATTAAAASTATAASIAAPPAVKRQRLVAPQPPPPASTAASTAAITGMTIPTTASTVPTGASHLVSVVPPAQQAATTST